MPLVWPQYSRSAGASRCAGDGWLGELRSFLVCAAALVVCGCAAPIVKPIPPGPVDATIYVVSHAGHTGIALRKADVPAGLWPELRDFPDARYLEVGWGDADYYPMPDPGLCTTLKAAFLPTDSVLHVVGFDTAVPRYFSGNEVVAIGVPRAAAANLARYIDDAYRRSDAAPAVAISPGLYGDSRFYPARQRFHLLRTCNVWIAGALRAAGLPVHDDITSAGLMAQVRALGRVVQPAQR